MAYQKPPQGPANRQPAQQDPGTALANRPENLPDVINAGSKALMEQPPSIKTMAVLAEMESSGLLEKDVKREAALIFMSMTEYELSRLKVRDLIRAAEMVVKGKVQGVDFYLVPDLGVVESVIGIQRELGERGLPPADLSFRQMTEQERKENMLTDPREYGVVCTAAWNSLGLKVHGIGVVDLDDMFPGRSYKQNGVRIVKPEAQWVYKNPIHGRTYLWTACKRAKKDAFQNVRGFIVVTPKQRIEAGRNAGLNIGLTDQQAGYIDADQAKAAINQAAVQDAIDRREHELLELMGEADYAALVVKRLRKNVERLHGPETDDPLGIDAPVVAAAVNGAKVEGEIILPDGFDLDDEDEFGDAPLDFDLMQQLHDAQRDYIAKDWQNGEPATDKQMAIWKTSITKEVGEDGYVLVTARLAGASIETVDAGEWKPSRAQVKSWMVLCLSTDKAKDFPVSDQGKEFVLLFLTEAQKAAGILDEDGEEFGADFDGTEDATGDGEGIEQPGLPL